MTEDGRTLAAYLLTGPHSNMLGCFRIPDGYVCEDLHWESERVSEGFQILFEKGFATRSEGSKWVVIHKFLKWNQPENPNVVKAAEKLFDQIPDACGLKPLLATCIAEYEPRFSSAKLKGFEMVSKGLPKGIPPEPEPNQNLNQGKALSGNPDEVLPKNSETIEAVDVLEYLNEKTGRHFRPVASNIRLVKGRLASGVTAEVCKQVIDAKVSQWLNDPKMEDYLRPGTLFAAQNFEQYLGQLAAKKPRDSEARFEN